MPRAKTNKFYRTFSKGLITEAGYLTYPEDASSDELNTILSRKGNRSRRLGLDYQIGSVLNELPEDVGVSSHEFVWQAVNQDPNVSFVCVQIGGKVNFFKMNNLSLSSQLQLFSVDLLKYKIPSASTSDLTSDYVDFSAGSGLLFIAHRFMDPVSVEYLPDTNTLSVIPIVIQVRDFEGVYDTLANDDEPATLSAQHHYNLLNQGWVTPGSKVVDVSTPNYTPVDEGISEPYYDPYTGETTFPEGRSGGFLLP